jgi:hypothetical protein
MIELVNENLGTGAVGGPPNKTPIYTCRTTAQNAARIRHIYFEEICGWNLFSSPDNYRLTIRAAKNFSRKPIFAQGVHLKWSFLADTS